MTALIHDFYDFYKIVNANSYVSSCTDNIQAAIPSRTVRHSTELFLCSLCGNFFLYICEDYIPVLRLC